MWATDKEDIRREACFVTSRNGPKQTLLKVYFIYIKKVSQEKTNVLLRNEKLLLKEKCNENTLPLIPEYI